MWVLVIVFLTSLVFWWCIKTIKVYEMTSYIVLVQKLHYGPHEIFILEKRTKHILHIFSSVFSDCPGHEEMSDNGGVIFRQRVFDDVKEQD